MSKKLSTNRHFRQIIKKFMRQGHSEQDATELAANRLGIHRSISPEPPAGATVLSDEEHKALFGEPELAQEPA